VHDDADPSPWPVRGAGLWWRHVLWLNVVETAGETPGKMVVQPANMVVE